MVQLCTRTMSCYCETCITGNICNTWSVIDNSMPLRKRTNTHTSSTEVDVASYHTGYFVAAVYEGQWYVGQIVDDDPDSDGYDYQVSFMQKKKMLFQWPRNKDAVWRQKSHILCVIGIPIALAGKSMRMYRILEDDLAKIERCFSDMLFQKHTLPDCIPVPCTCIVNTSMCRSVFIVCLPVISNDMYIHKRTIWCVLSIKHFR